MEDVREGSLCVWIWGGVSPVFLGLGWGWALWREGSLPEVGFGSWGVEVLQSGTYGFGVRAGSPAWFGPRCQLAALSDPSLGVGGSRVPWAWAERARAAASREFVPSLLPELWTSAPTAFAIPRPATCGATSQSHFPSPDTPQPPHTHTHTGRTSCSWPEGQDRGLESQCPGVRPRLSYRGLGRLRR